MFRSIRWRIAIPYLVLILVTMLSLGLYLSNNIRRAQLMDLEAGLVDQALLLGGVIERMGEDTSSTDQLDELVGNWSQVTNARVTILNPAGTVIGESHGDKALMENHLGRPEVQDAIDNGQGTSTRFSQTLGQDMLYVAISQSSGGEIRGFVRVALPVSEVETTLDSVQRSIITVTLVAAIIATILATLIAARITNPIRDLTEAAEQVSIGNLDTLPSPNTEDEISQLVIAFNRMALALYEQLEALNVERTKLAAVLERMDDGVLIVDPDGKVQLLNPSAERMFQIKEEEALDLSVVEVLRHHELIELWRLAKERGEEQVSTFEIGLENRSLQVVVTPLGNALPGSMVMVLQDLTRLRRLETVRSDFISNISHELRTPLASLKALAETLREGAFDDPPAARRFLFQIETEVDALTQMVQELLELTRIESGRVPLQFQAVPPHAIVNSAVDRLQVQAERAGLTVNVDCPDNLPEVLVDPPRIEQVIVNLLHNAIKFTPMGGEIYIKAVERDGDILFSVRDTGIGIPPEDLPRIFERFFKGDRARSGGGTGLGLAIARHLVEAHGGTIWAESDATRGSTFYLTIPQAG